MQREREQEGLGKSRLMIGPYDPLTRIIVSEEEIKSAAEKMGGESLSPVPSTGP